MSVNHEIEAVQIDRPSGTLLRLERNCNVIFFKLLYGFYFLDAIPSWVFSQTF
jgi:hypothetical protein